MNEPQLKYIVLMLNPETAQYTSDGRRIDTHDGVILDSIDEAREEALEWVEEKLCTRFVIGRFLLDKNSMRRTEIQLIETWGFRNDRKNPQQLELFKKG